MVNDKESRESTITRLLMSPHYPDRAASLLGKTRDLTELLDLLPGRGDPERRKSTDAALAGMDAGIFTICLYGEEAYPPLLIEIADPPPLLFCRGTIPKTLMLGVVGSRRATPYGRQAAEKIAHDLARMGVTIVSGLARGIDGVAHQAALEAEGTTVAVLGSGITTVYPKEHVRLAEAIVEKGGAIITEFPPDTPPLPHHFPRRNRIIAGMCRGVVVVEAGLKSGSLITARLALEENRDIFVVPGPIFQPTFQGSHSLIRQGALLVASAGEIAQEYDEITPSGTGASQEVSLSEEEWTIYGLLDPSTPRHPDELIEKSGLTISTVGQSLTSLDLKGLVKILPGGLYIKKVV